MATLLFHLISSPHISGRRLWRLSFTSCHRIHRCSQSVGTASDNPFTHVHTFLCMYIHMCTICFHCVISLGTACGDSVFCCSGTASGDPCHFNLYHRTMYFCGHRQWQHCYKSTFIHLSFDFNATFLSGHRLCRRGFLFCHRMTYIHVC